ncbi:hypothetical protein VCHA54P500_30156 [Vibrio chagasii]|nr:hypothetical protein VCHA40O236_30154 [Vibrio chagasii]CAH7276901.1 hypothetical protein VCHA54P500_30156 [Vibrio chagasii]CAH7438015.1 hypothetical protein VCHA53O462_30154 [Vibrio chagasii]
MVIQNVGCFFVMGSYWGSKKEPSKLKLKLIDQYHNKNP